MSRPNYNASKSYQWNYNHAPEPVQLDVPRVLGNWTFCGLPVSSPLGIPAGPLLNARWVLYYASLGFDVLTYKTVRSSQRDCYEPPNLVPIEPGICVTGQEHEVAAADAMRDSWAVSFGMPSTDPGVWQDDVRFAKAALPPGKLLCVSVVGTAQAGWSIEQLASDYAHCARLAVASGADVVEANFSCPNVTTQDGQLFQQPAAAGLVAARIRDAIGQTPLCIKIGHINDRDGAAAFLQSTGPHVTALAMTNCIAAAVRNAEGVRLFNGGQRGIAGTAILGASIDQVHLFADLITKQGLPIRIIGVGGASTALDVERYLNAGAECVHLATAAMVDPLVAVRIKSDLRRCLGG